MCAKGEQLCREHFENLIQSTGDPKSVLNRIRPLAQVPELHSAIVAFLVGAKTLLDFLVQLTCAEGVISASLGGFHRSGDEYGGRFLNCLENNTEGTKKDVATRLEKLTRNHKKLWIDGLIRARDELTHPTKGALQCMIEMHVDASADRVVLSGVSPPVVAGKPVDEYVGQVNQRSQEFARSMLDCLGKS